MFEDFFTTYNMVEPPEIYKDNPNLTIPDISGLDIILGLESPITQLNTMSYPGVVSPFEQAYSDDFEYVSFQGTDFNKDLLKLDIEDLLRQENITQINGKPIKFGSKQLRTSDVGSPDSWHRKTDADTGNASARDISIVGGTTKDYADFKNILLNNQNVQNWMQAKGWGIINEITSEILSQTKGTGNHFHFGPDSWARNTWRAWNDNPSAKVTTSFRYYKPSSKNFNNNEQFVKTLMSAYEKALQNRGLDPRYAPMLVAQDANESGWGKSVKGNFNYGNITAKDGEPWHNQTGKRKWRDFTSVDDYVNSKIDFLSRSRYKFFQTFSSSANVAVAMQTLANRGYDPNNPNYGKRIERTYNTVLKYLT